MYFATVTHFLLKIIAISSLNTVLEGIYKLSWRDKAIPRRQLALFSYKFYRDMRIFQGQGLFIGTLSQPTFL